MESVFVIEDADGTLRIRFKFNQWVIDQIKACVPGFGRSYDPATRVWSVHAPWAAQAIAILEAAFGEVPIQRAQRAEPQFGRGRTGREALYAELHLLPSAPSQLVTGAYKILAKLHHPDHGGDTAAMQRINRAFDQLKAERP